MGTYRGLLDDISGVDGTYKQQLKAIAEGGGGGGGGIMYVTITSEEVDGDTVYSADKTFAEIAAAVEAGQVAVARVLYGSNDFEQHYMCVFQNTAETKYISWNDTYLYEDSPDRASIEQVLVEIQSDGVADTVELKRVEKTIL